MRLILSVTTIYLMLNTIYLEQTIREYKHSTMKKKECADMLTSSQDKFNKLLDESNRTWEKAIIDSAMEEL